MEQLLEILIPVGLALLCGLVWLVRLEGRVNLVSKESSDVSDDYYEHKNDRDIHPKASDLDRRFAEFHGDIAELKKDVSQGFVEVNRRLDVVLQKQ